MQSIYKHLLGLYFLAISLLIAEGTVPETNRQKNLRIMTGAAILSTEYIIGYSLAYHMWWPHGFRKINPFTNIGENEPFYIDEATHISGNIFSQEIHYQIMRYYFHIESPWPSMILTSLSWLSIEALDAMEKRDGWKFSINDEIGNLLGVSFWYLKHHYPDVPIFFRIGFRQWDKAVGYINDLPLLFIDREKYGQKHNADKYSILKTELIYKFYSNYYTGIAVSRLSADSEKNVWGLTIGWDGINYMVQKNNRWWHRHLNFINKNLSMSLSFTYWTDNIITPI